MTNRHLVQKWLVYALGLLPLWMLDCYILSRYPILGVTPMLLPLAVVAVATLEGQLGGGGFGIWVGFLWKTTYPVAPGGMIFFLALFGYLVGKSIQYGLQKGFFGFFLCSVAVLVSVEFLWMLGWAWRGLGSWGDLLALGVKQSLLSLMYTPLVYVVFQKVFKKVGGSKLA